MSPRGRALAVLVLVLGAAAGTAAGPAPAAHAGPGDPQCARPATTPDPSVPWAQRRLGAERAWAQARGGSTLVAVVDTGVSAASPALAGAVAAGLDVRSRGRADTDCSGHGTFVAGLLAARPTAGSGLVGVAPAARVLPIRVTDNPDQVSPAMLAAGIRAAVDAGAGVIAVSVSTPVNSAAVRTAAAYAERREVVVVAAAETAADPTSDPTSGASPAAYPAALSRVLAVAPIGPDGTAMNGTSAASGPDVAAPGSDLTSIAPRGPGTLAASGRGLAVAFVAGAAALVRSYRPQLSASAVRQRLAATADHPSTELPHPLLGYGVVDPAAAVETVLPQESGEVAPSPVPQPIQVPAVARTDPRPGRLALTAAAALTGVVGLGGLVAATASRGRRRRWRPAGAPASADA